MERKQFSNYICTFDDEQIIIKDVASSWNVIYYINNPLFAVMLMRLNDDKYNLYLEHYLPLIFTACHSMPDKQCMEEWVAVFRANIKRNEDEKGMA